MIRFLIAMVIAGSLSAQVKPAAKAEMKPPAKAEAVKADAKPPVVKIEDKAAVLEMQRDIHAAEIKWLQARNDEAEAQKAVEPLVQALKNKMDSLKIEGFHFDPQTVSYVAAPVVAKVEPEKK